MCHQFLSKQFLKSNRHHIMNDQELSNLTLHELDDQGFCVGTDLLTYLRSELPDKKIAYEIAPRPLVGGNDSRIYHYKLQGKQPRVLRILRPNREAGELLYLQSVYQTLSHHGMNVPLIHRVCEDKSVLGGCFAVMDLLPGKTLSVQEPEVQAQVLGESMANMHDKEVMSIVDELRESGIPDQHFLSPDLLKNWLDSLEKNYPWTSEHVGWLRERLPLSSGELSIVHGDYHPGNLIFEEGLVTGVLDWGFCVADPAMDLAHITNLCLLFMHHFFKDIPLEFCEQYLEKIFNAYSQIRPVNHDRIHVFRVLELLRLLCFADKIPEQLQSSEAQQGYVAFIEDATGLPLMFDSSPESISTLSSGGLL